MKLFLGGIVLTGLAFFSPLATAADTTTIYEGAATGDFEEQDNYSNGAPSYDNGPLFNVSGATYTITQTTDDVIPSMEISGSGGVLNFNSSGNTLEVLGSAPTGTGNSDFTVTGGATFNYSGGGTFLFDSGVLDVGDTNGTGTFNLQSGTLNYDVQSVANDTQINVGDSGTGSFVESGTASVVMGESLFIGTNGGNGTYTLTGGSTLQTGTNLSNYYIIVGSDSNGNVPDTMGSLILSGSSKLSVNAGGQLIVGDYVPILGSLATAPTSVQSKGMVTQSGSSEVDITGASDENLSYLNVGNYSGTTGTYNLEGGTLHLFQYSVMGLGDDAGSSGTLNQTGGSFIEDANATFYVGYDGTGAYNLSGGTATFNGYFSVGGIVSSTGSGTLTQSGGTLNNLSGYTYIGGAAGSSAGIYNMEGGTANLGYVDVGATGTINQTGGNFIAPIVDLSALGATYNLNGGILQVSLPNGLVGTSGEGTLNFGGGTLAAVNPEGLVDALDGTVTGNSVLEAGLGITLQLTGNLTGTGGFTIAGPGGTVVLNANTNSLNGNVETFTGPTRIESTLELHSNDATDSFLSGIEGDGNLDLTFSQDNATIQLKGTSDFTGTTTIEGDDTLQLYNGKMGAIGAAPLESGAANLIIGQDGTDLTAPLTGTVTLTGTNFYTGTTTVEPDFTLLATSLADSTNVTNTGTLGSSSITIGTPFQVGGTLNMPEGMTAGAPEGTLLVRIGGNVADTYSATDANLYGNVGYSGYSKVGTTSYLIVSTTGTLVTGQLNNTDSTDEDRLNAVSESPSLLLTATLSSTGNDLYLDVTQQSLAQYAQTPNQRAVAAALNQGFDTATGFNPLLSSFDNNLTVAEIPNALDQVSPRAYLYMRDIAFENSTFLAEGINGKLANIRNGFSGIDTSGLSIANPGMESDIGRNLLAYNDEAVAPNGVNYYPDDGTSSSSSSPLIESSDTKTISDTSDLRSAPTVAGPPSTIFDGMGQGINEFLSGDVIVADLNQNSVDNIPKAHYTAGDATAGVSFRMTSNLIAGVLFDYNHTEARTDSEGSHIREDSYSPGLFASYFNRGFYVNGLFTYGFNNYGDTRNLSFPGFAGSAKSSPQGQQYSGDLDFGYDFHPDKHWIIGPTFGVQYTHLDVDSFQESGAGPADLFVDSQSANSIRARLGGHVVYQIRSGSVLFQPNLTASVQHEFLDDTFGLTSQLPGGPDFTIQGTNPGRNSGLIGLGVTATLDNTLSFYLNYLAEVGGGDYFVQNVEGGIKASF